MWDNYLVIHSEGHSLDIPEYPGYYGGTFWFHLMPGRSLVDFVPISNMSRNLVNKYYFIHLPWRFDVVGYYLEVLDRLLKTSFFKGDLITKSCYCGPGYWIIMSHTILLLCCTPSQDILTESLVKLRLSDFSSARTSLSDIRKSGKFWFSIIIWT